jgi:hypothetical protein
MMLKIVVYHIKKPEMTEHQRRKALEYPIMILAAAQRRSVEIH